MISQILWSFQLFDRMQNKCHPVPCATATTLLSSQMPFKPCQCRCQTFCHFQTAAQLSLSLWEPCANQRVNSQLASSELTMSCSDQWEIENQLGYGLTNITNALCVLCQCMPVGNQIKREMKKHLVCFSLSKLEVISHYVYLMHAVVLLIFPIA